MKLFENFPMDMDVEDATQLEENGTELEDLPTSLIITNVDILVYSDQEQKNQFEALFRRFQDEATFQYFKSFRRARVNYSSPAVAAKARIECHQTRIGDSVMNCYFAQPKSESKESGDDSYLQPPSPVRQFLISPPASPPEGWEPHPEAEPMVNMDLLAAIASLSPGESHELHPPSESQPGIVVHVCEDQVPKNSPKLKIVQTRCPERRSSLDSDSP